MQKLFCVKELKKDQSGWSPEREETGVNGEKSREVGEVGKVK